MGDHDERNLHQDHTNAPKVVEFKAVDAMTFEHLSLDELKSLRKAVSAALKVHAEAAKAKLPKVGQRVKIVGGSKRDIGKSGEIIAARQTRVFIKLDGEHHVPYVLMGDVENI